MSRRALCHFLLAAICVSAVGYSQTPARGAQSPASTTRVTFAETIAPIVYANCVTCHRPGEAAPFSLLSYEDVAKRGALIARVTESRYMPPWHAQPGYGEFVGERRLTDAQIASIATWVKQGMPRGDESRMPRLPEFPPDGWRLGQPDLVLEMPAFEVPASGPDVFRNFVIPTRLAEDRWVRGIEFRPNARKVVHHAIFAHVPGGSRAALDGADGRPGFGGLGAVGLNDGADSGGLGGWAVGASPMMLPEALTARLPKGSDFLLQMHFHPSGKVETERSLVGIYFADKGPDRDVVSIGLPTLFGFGAGIDIPPGEKGYTIRDSFTLPGDGRVYMANAHAHYLAREMRATATLPDGSSRQLLWIHDWDFNWQDSYLYKEPFVLPKGTRIDVRLSYDNSADNPKNPINPPRRALFGEQSFDEMGAVSFAVEVLSQQDLPSFRQALAARNKLAIAAAGKDGTLGRFLARGARRGLQQITILDRQGTVVSRIGEPASYAQAAFSPDASRIAVVRNESDGDGRDIWTFDVATGRSTAITSDAPQDSSPIWSPDGRHIAFVSVRENTPVIYRRASDGTGSEELLYRHTSGAAFFLTDWSPDGRWLSFWAGDSLFVLPLAGDRTPIRLGVARGGRFSPDSRLLAFNASQEAGRFQVFVKPLDEAVGQASVLPAALISAGGGVGGIFWRSDGKELFFLSQPPGQSVMTVDITSTEPLTMGTPKVLFRMDPQVGAPAQISSIASPDGQRFVFALNVVPRPAGAAAPTPAVVTAPSTPAPAPAPTVPGRSPQAGLAQPIVDDLLRGFGGDVPALKRGLDASTSRLAELPDDPETLAWNGAALLSWARQGNTIVGFEAIVQNFQRATGQMNKAVSLQPDNPRVRMARGVLLQVETPGMPRFANHPGLVENAREDYQRLFDLRQDGLGRLGTHRLGELLQGLGDLYSRQGKAEEAERYYQMLQTRLPKTEYARRAGEWLLTKQPLPTPMTTCIGCHETP